MTTHLCIVMGKITREDRIVIKALLVFILIKICLKFASHHFLLYVVYMCQKSLNFTYAFKCYHQKCKLANGLTLAGSPRTSALKSGAPCRHGKCDQ